MKKRKKKESIDTCHTVIVCGRRLTQWMKQEVQSALKFQKEIIVSTPELFTEVVNLVGEAGATEFNIQLNPEYITRVGLNNQMESVSYLLAGAGGA